MRRGPAIGALVLFLVVPSCLPGDRGRSINVMNGCSSAVEFLMDGGDPPPVQSGHNSVRLEAGISETYSVLVGDKQPAYFWLLQPASDLVVIPAPSASSVPGVVLAGEPCVASVTLNGPKSGR